MAAQRIQEIPFTDRINIREKVLAWISSDIGLCEFLVPDALAESWSPEQKQTWTNVIVDKFLVADNTEVGRVARARVMAREQAGTLRRGCDKLRQGQATYRDIAKMGVTMEGLWNDISSDLDDPTWAKCSLLFDTALISLRVAYLWLYDKTENNGASVDTRKKVFQTLLDSFFSENAPTDDKDDKHSANFRDLLGVWRTELQKYMDEDDFEQKLDKLEETQPLLEVASGIERFLGAVNIDQSWLWKMKLVDDELQDGHLVRKGRRGRKSKNARVQKEPSPEPIDEGPAQPPEQDSSSFEPAAVDSDFDYDDAEQQKERQQDEEDDHDDDDDYDTSDMEDDLARGMMSERRENGSVVRRSLRVARGGVGKKRASRPPRRLEDSPPRRRKSTRKRRRATVNEVMDDLDADDEPPLENDSPYRGALRKYTTPSGGTGALQAFKKKLKVQRRKTGRAVRRTGPPTRAPDEDDVIVPRAKEGLNDDISEPGLALHDTVAEGMESAAEARRRRLMAALTED